MKTHLLIGLMVMMANTPVIMAQGFPFVAAGPDSGFTPTTPASPTPTPSVAEDVSRFPTIPTAPATPEKGTPTEKDMADMAPETTPSVAPSPQASPSAQAEASQQPPPPPAETAKAPEPTPTEPSASTLEQHMAQAPIEKSEVERAKDARMARIHANDAEQTTILRSKMPKGLTKAQRKQWRTERKQKIAQLQVLQDTEWTQIWEIKNCAKQLKRAESRLAKAQKLHPEEMGTPKHKSVERAENAVRTASTNLKTLVSKALTANVD